MTPVEGSYFNTTICLRKLEKGLRVRAGDCQHSMPISIDLPLVETQKSKIRFLSRVGIDYPQVSP